MRREYVGTRLATGKKASHRSERKRPPLRRRRPFENIEFLLAILGPAIPGYRRRTAQLAGPLRGIESLSGATGDDEARDHEATGSDRDRAD